MTSVLNHFTLVNSNVVQNFNNIVAVPHDHLIRIVLPTRGHDSRFTQLASRTKTYLNSLFPSTVRLWNALQSFVIDSTDLNLI